MGILPRLNVLGAEIRTFHSGDAGSFVGAPGQLGKARQTSGTCGEVGDKPGWAAGALDLDHAGRITPE